MLPELGVHLQSDRLEIINESPIPPQDIGAAQINMVHDLDGETNRGEVDSLDAVVEDIYICYILSDL